MVQASSDAQIQNVVLLGGTGTVGSKILAALVKKGFNVTVLSRAESNAEFPFSVKVAKGDFNDAAFLQSALRGNEAFIITLGVMAPEDLQHKLLEAAAQADVKYVLPNEFGHNNGDPQIAECIFVHSKKTQYREKAETLGLTWFGIANGFWTDYSAAGGYFGVDVLNRTADIWDDGKATLSVTTTDAAGHGVANLLALPKSKLDARANTFFLLSESAVSQSNLLAAAQKATSTTDDDWKIVRRSRQDAIAEAQDRMAKSDFSAFPLLLYATMFTPDLGSDFSGRNDNELLGLQTRSQDDLVQLFKESFQTLERDMVETGRFRLQCQRFLVQREDDGLSLRSVQEYNTLSLPCVSLQGKSVLPDLRTSVEPIRSVFHTYHSKKPARVSM